jgi:hypothetical protein
MSARRPWSTADAGSQAWLWISPREIRLVVERMLQVIGVAPGMRPSVHDAVVAAEVAGLNSLGLLSSDGARLARPFRAPTVAAAPAPFDLSADGHGQSLLLVAAHLLDLCREWLGRVETICILAFHVEDVSLLASLDLLAGRCGVHFSALFGIDTSGVVVAPRPGRPAGLGPTPGLAPGSVVLTASGQRARPAAPGRWPTTALHPAASDGQVAEEELAVLSGGPEYARALRDGVPVPADLWWSIWERSKLALAEESPTSMRHAGPVIVDAAGTVRGEPFEDL